MTQAVSLVGHIQIMDPYQAEKYIAGLFERLGYKATVTQASKDHGIDTILHKDGKKYVVQVKRYATSNRVNEKEVRDFRGSYADDPACTSGIFVTTSTYTTAARAWAQDKNITLWDAVDLAEQMQRIQT